MEKKEIKEKISKGWVKASIIFEIIGRPKEHIIEALNKLVEFLKQDKKLILLSEKINEAMPVEDKELFSSFLEIEVLLESPTKAMEFVYDYMPSSIEIIEPTSFNLKLNDLNNLLNDSASKLHRYDALLKQANMEKQIIFNKLKEVQEKLKDK